MILKPILADEAIQTHRGRPRGVSLQEVVNAILYIDRTGCQWALLPHDFLPKSTVYEYFAKWRDNGKWVEILTAANADDGTAIPRLLERVNENDLPRLSVNFGDNKYNNKSLTAWLEQHRPNWSIQVQSPPQGTMGFSPVRIRWVVERSNAWDSRCRRNSKDYERRPDSSEAMIQISHIGIMLRKCSPAKRPAFNYLVNSA